MLKKRVIFTLLYDNGSFMLSRNFRLQKVGDLKWLLKNYDFSQIAFSIDELIILNVSRDRRDLDKFLEYVRLLNDECFVPIASGGGIQTLEHARQLLHSGADKVVVNSLIGENPETVNDIAKEFGSQSIVVSVDVKESDGKFLVWTSNGSFNQEIELSTWIEKVSRLAVGELYLNSMNRDGTGQGYHFQMLDQLPEGFSIPVIIAGGAGKYEHLSKGLTDARVDSVATAHLFNFVGNGLEKARVGLLNGGHDLAVWNVSTARQLKNIFINE